MDTGQGVKTGEAKEKTSSSLSLSRNPEEINKGGICELRVQV
jgi:hypothetical protein